MQNFDVVISGGGFVGLTIAIGLAQKTPWKIALLEQSNSPKSAGSEFDARAIALVPSSIQLFEDLNIWKDLEQYTSTIEHIHVSEQSRFGQVQLNATDHGWEYFGKVIEAQKLGQKLLEICSHIPQVTIISPAQLTNFSINNTEVECEWQHQDSTQKAQAKLLIAADGANSFIRKTLAIETKTTQYDQSALIANVLPDRPHQQRAFERFTTNDPLALLPITQNRMTLIWCDAKEATSARAKKSDNELLTELQNTFGYRAGKFIQIGKRQIFELNQFIAKEQFRDRVVLLGNTAHTLHPVAAQGLNLSLRDITVLLKELKSIAATGGDPGARTVLQSYYDKRAADQKLIHRFTESLVFGFGLEFLGAGKLRSLGMTLFNCLPGLKKLFARRMMGVTQ